MLNQYFFSLQIDFIVVFTRKESTVAGFIAHFTMFILANLSSSPFCFVADFICRLFCWVLFMGFLNASISYSWCFKLYPQVSSKREGDFIKCNACNGCVGFSVLPERDISMGVKMLIFGLYHNFPILCKLFMMFFIFFLSFFFLASVCERGEINGTSFCFAKDCK